MTEPDETGWGSAAFGQSGEVTIEVDQALSGGDRWQLAVELPQFCLLIEIPSPSSVCRFRDFLEHHVDQDTSGELRLGTISNAHVSIIKDDEFTDRFFICVSADNGTVRQTLTGKDIPDFIAALTQADVELDR